MTSGWYPLSSSPGWYETSPGWERWWTGRDWFGYTRHHGRIRAPRQHGLSRRQVKWLLWCTIGLPLLPVKLWVDLYGTRRRW